jgi:hypothetical protein
MDGSDQVNVAVVTAQGSKSIPTSCAFAAKLRHVGISRRTKTVAREGNKGVRS